MLTYLLTYGAERFLRTHQLCSHSRTSQHFVEPEGLLPLRKICLRMNHYFVLFIGGVVMDYFTTLSVLDFTASGRKIIQYYRCSNDDITLLSHIFKTTLS
jgi:hypothetical protein